jgi:hypothetical protein
MSMQVNRNLLIVDDEPNVLSSLFDPEILGAFLEIQQAEARPIRPGTIRWH